MLIPKEVLCVLHPIYQDAIQNLEKEWETCEENDAKSKMNLLIEFSHNFLMLPQLWSELYRLSEAENSWDERKEISRKAYSHFCYVDENFAAFAFHKLLNQELDFSNADEYLDIYELSELKKMVKEFKCPHKNMDGALRFYEEYISSPIKKDVLNQFKKTKKLYDEIMASRDNLKLWFQNIIRVSDEEFIANNIEYRLGKDLNNLDLWKMYIGYLKCNNPKKLLTLYSKYCRYFTNDKVAKEEYEKATKIYGPSFVAWKNKFDFETPLFEGGNQKTEISKPKDKEADQTLKLISPFPLCKGNFESFQIQNFSLPNTIMTYLLQDDQMFKKLCKTCKLFFAVKQIPVFHNFVCKTLPRKEGVYFTEESVAVMFFRKYPKDAKIKFDHKFIISNSLNVTFHINPNILSSSIIPNMFRCDAKFIRLENQNLTMKEFQFLTENNTVEMLYLNAVRICKDDATTFMPMEEILEFVPSIVAFEIFSPTFSLETFQKLIKLKFINKIDIFKMSGLKYFEPFPFCEFLKKNLDKSAKVAIRFHETFFRNREESQKMKDVKPSFLKSLNDNWSIEDRPKVSFI